MATKAMAKPKKKKEPPREPPNDKFIQPVDGIRILKRAPIEVTLPFQPIEE